MQTAENYDQAFNALGDPTRRAIFEKLQQGPLSVVHIADGLPVSRPAVSQHLKVLKEAKLISIQQQGTRSICELNKEGILAMRNYLDKFWDDALEAFKALAEKEERLDNN
ncbi:metalloregulator ArsR/SmtB family transcription factor [Mucilaginibacter panaciglaebae]|uniref:Metalloregulator ArsR/SmtB family transcription factor n=1 Tax=Mucilaginibacter panaciglaebae TaxID=502331 RepID=A0ABP7WXE8_9SPHI